MKSGHEAKPSCVLLALMPLRKQHKNPTATSQLAFTSWWTLSKRHRLRIPDSQILVRQPGLLSTAEQQPALVFKHAVNGDLLQVMCQLVCAGYQPELLYVFCLFTAIGFYIKLR